MYLVHVYPLIPTAPLVLTYFSRKKYPRGACVNIPLRSKKVPGIVARCESAQNAKAALRTAAHTLSAIPAQDPTYPFLKGALIAAEEVAARHVASPGALLSAYFPKVWTHKKLVLPSRLVRTKEGRGFEIKVQQAYAQERDDARTLLIREYWAKRQSLLIVVPDRHVAMRVARACGSLPKDRIIVFHAGSTDTTLRESYASLERSAPRVIIATPTYAFTPRADIGCVYVQDESARGYLRETRPHDDVRVMLTAYAAALGVPCIFADTVLTPQTFAHYARGAAVIQEPFSEHIRAKTPLTIVDMHKIPKEAAQRELSPELLSLITTSSEKRKTCFILSGRRGIAGTVICSDCRTPVICAHCGAPLSLFGPKAEIRVPRLYCRTCGTARDSRERCATCTSWKLIALGAGSERIADMVKKYTSLPVVRIDRDTASTEKKSRALETAIAQGPALIVGTERALSFLPPEVPYTGIMSFDATLSVPELGVADQLLPLFMELRARTTEQLVVQTRLPQHPLLHTLQHGTIGEYLREELDVRRALGFPPHSVIIEILRVGKKETVQRDMARAAQLLRTFHPTLIPYVVDRTRGTLLTIHIPKTAWPEPGLQQTLRSLPPSFSIRVYQ